MEEKNSNTITEKDKEILRVDLSKVEVSKKENLSPVKKVIADEMTERKKKAKIFFAVNFGIFLFSIYLLAGLYYFISKPKDNLIATLTTNQEEKVIESASVAENLVERKIDGVKVPLGEDNNYLIAVMIDNHADARPHAGISQAHLVFEAEVEGGMTRIMGIFSTGQDLKEIGPVRSARPYFIDWARELSALYVHVGGSPDALVKIKQDKILDINEFFNGKYFWRGTNKPAPHNVYTSNENLEKYLADKGADRNRIIPWTFKDDKSISERATSSSIHVSYKLAQDKIEWKYDQASNYYMRFVLGTEYKDKNGESIYAKNIVIMEAGANELDEKLRLEMENIGTGKATICMDGKCAVGSWGKKHPSDRTRFFGEDGKEISFNRGMTWVQVVRPGIVYSITN